MPIHTAHDLPVSGSASSEPKRRFSFPESPNGIDQVDAVWGYPILNHQPRLGQLLRRIHLRDFPVPELGQGVK
jgi:hypothetical protein